MNRWSVMPIVKANWLGSVHGSRIWREFSRKCTSYCVSSMFFWAFTFLLCSSVHVVLYRCILMEKCGICHKEMLKELWKDIERHVNGKEIRSRMVELRRGRTIIKARISSWLSRNLSNVALQWGFLTSTREYRSISVIRFSEVKRITALLRYVIHLQFINKSQSRSIKCMLLPYCDL